jgi:hypothetical protein
MNKHIKLFFAIALLSTYGCEKDLPSGDPDFEIKVEKTNLTVRDTARFAFTGNPDILTFYSGEPGSRYAYKGRTEAEGTPLLSFSTVRANGSQPGSLRLLVSQDFTGVIKADTISTKTNISSATWTDITSRATLSTGATASVASGAINLADFSEKNRPVFIALKYSALSGSIQSKWTISNFSLKNTLADGTSYEIANMNTSTTAYTVYGVNTFSPGFAAYTLQNKYNWNVSNTSLVITGATTATAADAAAEAWVLIGPVNLKKVVPDIGKAVKNPTVKLNELVFRYQYSTPGTYKASFEGSTNSIDNSASGVKSLEIVVGN